MPTPSPKNQPAPNSLTVSGYSRFVQRIRRRYASQMGLLAEGAPVKALMQQTLIVMRGVPDTRRA